MRKFLFLSSVIVMLSIIGAGCSTDDNYCCTSNVDCGSVHGTQTFCTVKDCGKCEAPDQPLQISADWKDAVVGKPYEVELNATGGFSPYDWVGLSKFGDTNKLAWLVLEEDPNDLSKAYLRNGNNNGQPLFPSTPTEDTEELTIKVTVIDSTRHVDSEVGVEFSHAMKIYTCGEASDCTALPGDAACVDATCNAGKCDYPIKSGAECGAGGCNDGFKYTSQICNSSGTCEFPISDGISCEGYQCQDSVSCKERCDTKDDCVGSLLCHLDNHTCEGSRDPGGICNVVGECKSGFCVNNVCCKSSCTGNCQLCNAAGQEGTCVTAETLCTGNCDVCDVVSGNCKAADSDMCPAAVGTLCTSCQQISPTNFSCTYNDTLDGDCTSLYPSLVTECFSTTECRLSIGQACSTTTGLACINGAESCLGGTCRADGATVTATCQMYMTAYGSARISNGVIQTKASLGDSVCSSGWTNAPSTSCALLNLKVTATYNPSGVSVSYDNTDNSTNLCTAGPVPW